MLNEREIQAARRKGESPLDLARRFYLRAEYATASEILELAAPSTRNDDADVALLRARCALGLADLETAFTAANRAHQKASDPDRRLTARALQAVAARGLGRRNVARAAVRELARALERTTHASGEARYYLALDDFEDGRGDDAVSNARRNVAGTTFVAQSYVLLGAIAAERGRLAEAGKQYAAALRACGTGDPIGTATRATAALAAVALESVDVRLGAVARRSYASVAWTATLRDDRFVALSSLSDLALLEGNVAAAFFMMRAAGGAASSPARAALADVKAAAVSRILGDAGAQRLHLRRAWSVLQTERTRRDGHEIRSAFAAFAIEAATAMPGEARQAIAGRTRGEPAPNASRIERWIAAQELRAAGCVASASGNRNVAERALRAALDLWGALRCDFSGALTALDLWSATGDEAALVIVRSVLKRAPKAWFAKRFAGERGAIARLTPAERGVLARLLRGESAKTIGAALGRSPFTISNHTRKIFLAFGMNSRARVIAACNELGITPAQLERGAPASARGR